MKDKRVKPIKRVENKSIKNKRYINANDIKDSRTQEQIWEDFKKYGFC